MSNLANLLRHVGDVTDLTDILIVWVPSGTQLHDFADIFQAKSADVVNNG